MRAVHVLVAEDDDDHRFLTVRALREVAEVPLEIAAVSDGEQTLDYVYGRGPYHDRDRPDLLVLDLKMPKMDGFGVLERLKGDPTTASMPIVVLSSSNHTGDIDGAYDLGTNAYMTKPTSASGFREHLRCLASYWAGCTKLPSPPSSGSSSL